MNIDQILRDLEARFNKDLPEFYKRRIIFWYDQEREFEEDLDDISIPNVRIVKMSETNKFSLKKLLSYDDQDSNFLVYCPLVFKEKEDNWIFDIVEYSEDFRADLVSLQIAEMNLPDNKEFYSLLKKYKKFFKAKARREAIEKLSYNINRPEHLELAMLAYFFKCSMDPNLIIRELLMAGLDLEANKLYKDLVSYQLDETFWDLVARGTGYNIENRDLKEFFTYILLAGSAVNIENNILESFRAFDFSIYSRICYDLIEAWIRDTKDRDSFYRLVKIIEDDLCFFKSLKAYNIEAFISNEFFPCVDELILTKLMEAIVFDNYSPEYIFSVYEQRRVLAWFTIYESYYKCVFYMAKMKEFYGNNENAFHYTDPQALWQDYENKFYLMDTYYRKFQENYQNIIKNENNELDDLLKNVSQKAEDIYKNWFLEDLLSNWTRVCEVNLRDQGSIPGIRQQINFYRQNVATSDGKTYVIISDGMRYEVAKELALNLETNMQCQLEVESMQGVFPTITSFGMAALLPNKGLTTQVKNADLQVLIGDCITSMNNRERILKEENPRSKLIKYKDFIGAKREQRRLEVKDMEVVYIYHDQIDSTSHTSEEKVFASCRESIAELETLVKILVNELSAVRIFITADHGFLYTAQAFSEDDKVEKDGFKELVNYGRRYAIMDEDAEPSFLMPVAFVDKDSGLKAFTPRQNVRIKKQGGGINFVHGGISPQEMLVPLIKYRHLRNYVREYSENKNKYDLQAVELNLLSRERKITNMTFNLSFYQSEMLSPTREAGDFILYFIDDKNRKISDEVRVIADKNSDNDQDRIFNLRFTLREGFYSNRKNYKLLIIERDQKVSPKEIDFEIDLPFEIKSNNVFSIYDEIFD